MNTNVPTETQLLIPETTIVKSSEAVPKETVPQKLQKILGRMNEDIALADSGELKDYPEETVIDPAESEEIVTAQSQRSLEFARKFAYRRFNGEVLGWESLAESSAQNVAEFAKLEQSEDLDALFEKWFVEKHKFDDKPPGKMAKSLAKTQWRIMAQKKRNELLILEKQFYQDQLTQTQARLQDIDQTVDFPQMEKVEISSLQRKGETSIEDALNLAKEEQGTLKNLVVRRERIQDLILGAKKSYLAILKHPATAKQIGIQIAELQGKEISSSSTLALAQTAAVDNLRTEVVMFNTYLSNAGSALNEMTGSAKLAVIRGYISEIGELIKDITSLDLSLQRQMSLQMVDTIAALGSKLGMDETRIKLLFKRGKNRVLTGLYGNNPEEIVDEFGEEKDQAEFLDALSQKATGNPYKEAIRRIVANPYVSDYSLRRRREVEGWMKRNSDRFISLYKKTATGEPPDDFRVILHGSVGRGHGIDSPDHTSDVDGTMFLSYDGEDDFQTHCDLERIYPKQDWAIRVENIKNIQTTVGLLDKEIESPSGAYHLETMQTHVVNSIAKLFGPGFPEDEVEGTLDGWRRDILTKLLTSKNINLSLLWNEVRRDWHKLYVQYEKRPGEVVDIIKKKLIDQGMPETEADMQAAQIRKDYVSMQLPSLQAITEAYEIEMKQEDSGNSSKLS